MFLFMQKEKGFNLCCLFPYEYLTTGIHSYSEEMPQVRCGKEPYITHLYNGIEYGWICCQVQNQKPVTICYLQMVGRIMKSGSYFSLRLIISNYSI